MAAMKKSVVIGLLVLALLAAYTAWPMVDLYRLATAVQVKDKQAVAEMIDFPQLRRSLALQIVAEYLELTGAKLGPMGTQMAAGFGATIADAVVARILNIDTLIDFLNGGKIPGANPQVPSQLSLLNSAALASAWQTWLSSEYRGTRFDVSLPPGKPGDQQFRLRLNISHWKWKLTGLEMPKPLRVQLAQEVIRNRSNAK